MIPSTVIDWRQETVTIGCGSGPTVVMDCYTPGRDVRVMIPSEHIFSAAVRTLAFIKANGLVANYDDLHALHDMVLACEGEPTINEQLLVELRALREANAALPQPETVPPG